ncbi:hypothetical protein T4E_11088, partial [Trichinella pseudospiralis]
MERSFWKNLIKSKQMIKNERQLASSNLACKQEADTRFTCQAVQFNYEAIFARFRRISSCSRCFNWKSANWLQFSETAARTMQSSHFSFFKLLCIDNIYCKIERSYYACTLETNSIKCSACFSTFSQ